ncbi:MAG: 16S rRNA (uracil(1498)-N(3))-methyltransferase [Desulfobacterales bacterium]
MRHFYIHSSATPGSVVAIENSEAHHIKNVLRLKTGAAIKLFDGTGYEYEAVIKDLSGAEVKVEIRSRVQAATGSKVQIVVAQAFLKDKKMDELLRRLTELGVSGFIPFFCRRAIAKPDASRLAGRRRRWHRIAAEALKQCRRIDLPEIGAAHSFEEVLEVGKTCDLSIVFWEKESISLLNTIETDKHHPLKRILLMMGPEGGFARREVEMATDSGFFVAGLGPRILRAETATLAACAIVQYLFGDMGPKKFVDKNSGV